MKRPEALTLGEPLLEPRDVATWLKVSVRTLGNLPIKRVKLGPRMVRYRREDVTAYIERVAA